MRTKYGNKFDYFLPYANISPDFALDFTPDFAMSTLFEHFKDFEAYVLYRLRIYTEYADYDTIKTFLELAYLHKIVVPSALMKTIFDIALNMGSIEFFAAACKCMEVIEISNDICLCPDIDFEKYQYLVENHYVVPYMSSFEKAVKKNVEVVKYYFKRLVDCPQCTPMLLMEYIKEVITNDAIPVEVLSTIFEYHKMPGLDHDIAKPIDHDKLRVFVMEGNAILYDSSKKEENTKVPSRVATDLLIEIIKREDIEFIKWLRFRANPSKYQLKERLSDEFHHAQESGNRYVDCFLESEWHQKIANLLMKFGTPKFLWEFMSSKNICSKYTLTFFNLRANEHFENMANCLIDLGFAQNIACSAFSTALKYSNDVAIIDTLLSRGVDFPTNHEDYFKFRLLAILNDRADIIALILNKLNGDAKLIDMLVTDVNVKNLPNIKNFLLLQGVDKKRFLDLAPPPSKKPVVTTLTTFDHIRIKDEVNKTKLQNKKWFNNNNNHAKRLKY